MSLCRNFCCENLSLYRNTVWCSAPTMLCREHVIHGIPRRLDFLSDLPRMQGASKESQLRPESWICLAQQSAACKPSSRAVVLHPPPPHCVQPTEQQTPNSMLKTPATPLMHSVGTTVKEEDHTEFVGERGLGVRAERSSQRVYSWTKGISMYNRRAASVQKGNQNNMGLCFGRLSPQSYCRKSRDMTEMYEGLLNTTYYCWREV